MWGGGGGGTSLDHDKKDKKYVTDVSLTKSFLRENRIKTVSNFITLPCSNSSNCKILISDNCCFQLNHSLPTGFAIFWGKS